MNITIVHNSKIPALKYGGIERVIWYLAWELKKMGHQITFLVAENSYCPFAKVQILNPQKSIHFQIPEHTDFVHFHFQPNEEIDFPHLITIHGNLPETIQFQLNTNFVSANHAERFGADAFVYNGLDWDDYGDPDFSASKNYVHFLGKAAWRIKNVRGAIKIAAQNKTEIKILGGTRINLKMGPRFTTSKCARFYGMVGGEQKLNLLKYSKGLIFPVLWHEPFGLAIIESLYFGAPVLGTKLGSLPELVGKDVGFLSNSENELIKAFSELGSFDSKKCHEYARENFHSKKMAENYVELYRKILNGEKMNRKKPVYNKIQNLLNFSE